MTQRTRNIVIGVAVVVVLAVAGGVFALTSGGGSDKKQATTTVPTTTIPATTTTKAPPIAPLTGLVDPSGASLTRPALAVKVENTPTRPQAGIDQADVVYEEVVEGNITRFVAIFNSADPRRHRPRPLGACRRSRHRLADRRDLRLLRAARR